MIVAFKFVFWHCSDCYGGFVGEWFDYIVEVVAVDDAFGDANS